MPPDERGKAIILTSGTTGTPKGASRSQPRSLDPAAALLAMIPLKAREKTMIAAPMFHSWGYVHFTLGMSLSSTLVLNRKFDPEETLSLTAQHEATALIVVPVMMQRILELPDEVLKRYDLSKLRVVAVSGSALPGAMSDKWMDLFGENVYNLYGSTEVAWASIATPEDLRAAPGTAGRPPHGTIVKLYGEDGKPVAHGETGPHLRRQRDAVRGLHGRRQQGRHRRPALLRRRRPLRRGRAPVRRRPRRRHDRLRRRERVPGRGRGPAGRPRRHVEVAVFGVDDEKFGQRLKAVVVKKERLVAGRGRGQEARQGQPRGLQGAARRRVHGRAAADLDGQGPQA